MSYVSVSNPLLYSNSSIYGQKKFLKASPLIPHSLFVILNDVCLSMFFFQTHVWGLRVGPFDIPHPISPQIFLIFGLDYLGLLHNVVWQFDPASSYSFQFLYISAVLDIELNCDKKLQILTLNMIPPRFELR